MDKFKAISSKLKDIPVALRHGAEEIGQKISDVDTNQLMSLNVCGCNNIIGCAPCAANVMAKGVALGIQAMSLVGRGPHRSSEKTVK